MVERIYAIDPSVDIQRPLLSSSKNILGVPSWHHGEDSCRWSSARGKLLLCRVEVQHVEFRFSHHSMWECQPGACENTFASITHQAS